MHSLSTMSIFVAVILFAMVHMQMIIAQNCDPNEVHTDCGSPISCQPSCDKPNGKPCPRQCIVNSCMCKEGFVRDNNNNNQCIDPTECSEPKTTFRSKCGPNEVKSRCAPLQTCQPSCNYRNGTACPLICSRNPCVCKEGFIRHSEEDLTCIEETQCNTMTCGENEEYDNCANPCQPSCDNPDQQPCETIRCSEGCRCSLGYLRASNDTTSPCIPCGEIIN